MTSDHDLRKIARNQVEKEIREATLRFLNQRSGLYRSSLNVNAVKFAVDALFRSISENMGVQERRHFGANMKNCRMGIVKYHAILRQDLAGVIRTDEFVETDVEDSRTTRRRIMVRRLDSFATYRVSTDSGLQDIVTFAEPKAYNVDLEPLWKVYEPSVGRHIWDRCMMDGLGSCGPIIIVRNLVVKPYLDPSATEFPPIRHNLLWGGDGCGFPVLWCANSHAAHEIRERYPQMPERLVLLHEGGLERNPT